MVLEPSSGENNLLSSLEPSSGEYNRPLSLHSVSFADPTVGVVTDPQDSVTISEAQAITKELFGCEQLFTSSSAWNSVMLNSIQTKARVGLKDDIRTGLLSKYEVMGELAALAPPKLNRKLIPALAPSVVKRHEYQARP